MKCVKQFFTFFLLCASLVGVSNSVFALGGPRVAVPSPPTPEEEAEQMKVPLTEEERKKAEELGLKGLVKEPVQEKVQQEKEHYITSIENSTNKSVNLTLIPRKKLAKEKGYSMGTIKSNPSYNVLLGPGAKLKEPGILLTKDKKTGEIFDELVINVEELQIIMFVPLQNKDLEIIINGGYNLIQAKWL